MAKISKSLQLLNSLVNDGMDFPDAEDRVQCEFSLTPAQVKEVRKRYDEDGSQKNDRVVTQDQFAGILGMYSRPL